jgi:hypothetical protein
MGKKIINVFYLIVFNLHYFEFQFFKMVMSLQIAIKTLTIHKYRLEKHLFDFTNLFLLFGNIFHLHCNHHQT